MYVEGLFYTYVGKSTAHVKKCALILQNQTPKIEDEIHIFSAPPIQLDSKVILKGYKDTFTVY